MIFEIKVGEAEVGNRLDVVISQNPAGITRSQVKNLIGQGQVTINGRIATKAGMVLSAGDLISVDVPAPVKLDLTPHDVGIKILYEDSDLAVLEKPSGISVHPSETERGSTVVHGLLHSLKSLSSVGGVERPGIVHRIDKGTSGILVVSKTDKAHLGLSSQFKAHTIDRIYHALVYSDVAAKYGTSGRIDSFYGRSPTNRKKMTGKFVQGRRAITHWKVIKTYGKALTLMECQLETGRTHQIRVHLSELGYPLVGDQLYGENERKARALMKHDRELADACVALNHQLLHARLLGFIHPITNKALSFQSELPADFLHILELSKKL